MCACQYNLYNEEVHLVKRCKAVQTGAEKIRLSRLRDAGNPHR